MKNWHATKQAGSQLSQKSWHAAEQAGSQLFWKAGTQASKLAANSFKRLACHRASWQPAFAKKLARHRASWQPALSNNWHATEQAGSQLSQKSWHGGKQAGSQLFQKTGAPPSKLAASFRKKAGTPASKLAASSFEKLARHQASWPAATKRHVQHFRAEQHIGKFFVSLHALLVEVVVHLLSSAKVSTPHLQANIFKTMAEKNTEAYPSPNSPSSEEGWFRADLLGNALDSSAHCSHRTMSKPPWLGASEFHFCECPRKRKLWMCPAASPHLRNRTWCSWAPSSALAQSRALSTGGLRPCCHWPPHELQTTGWAFSLNFPLIVSPTCEGQKA